MKSFALVLVVFAAIGIANAFYWDNGDTIRAFKIASNNADRFDVRAARKDKSTGDIDAIQFVFSHLGVPRFILRYFEKNSDTAELVAVRWNFLSLIEYNETDGEPGFSAGDDVVKKYRLFGINSLDTRWGAGFTTEHNVTVGYFKVCASFSGTAPRPNITLCATVTPRPFKNADGDFHPNAVKWSLKIDGAYYSAPNTQYALKVGIDARDFVRQLNTSDPENDSQDTKLHSLFVERTQRAAVLAGWVANVTLSGGNGCAATAPVVRSPVYRNTTTFDSDDYPILPDGITGTRSVQVVYFSFVTTCQPSGVYWDPELGVAVESSSSLAAPSFVLLLVAIIALFNNFL